MAVKASATITLSFMVDVSAVYRYYKLQASTASAPTVPIANPPPGWTDAEPNYTSGNTQTLYTVDCTVFANDTFLYSAVSKSSSYEAAKEAYNKALAAENAAIESGKTATNYLAYVNGSLMVSDMTDPDVQLHGGETWQNLNTLHYIDLNGVTWQAFNVGKNVLINPNNVQIRDNDTVLASFGASGIEFDQTVAFRSDGVLLDNGDAFTYLGRNTLLWSGSGYFMHGTQSITLSSNISRQISGAVFAWSLYQNGAAVNNDWHFFFVPKHQVANFGGNVVRMQDAYLGMNKILYVSNGNVSGHSQNATSGTTNGIAWNNTQWVLRYVVGV